VHRDLKPENILLLPDGQVKVTDVGLTSLLSETGLSKTDVMLAGVGYMSPEQARGNPVGPASDIYNIGVLLFEMLTGRLPFESSDAWKVVKMHAQDTPPSAHDINHKVPVGLSRIVDQALHKESSGRFASAAEMEIALAELPQSESFWWHWLPVRIKAGERFSLRPLLASFRKHVSFPEGLLSPTIAATLRRISPNRRTLILHYLASFLIAFAILFFLSGHLLDGASQAANDSPQVQLVKTAPEINDGQDQPAKVPTLLSSQNSTVPSSLLIGLKNVITEPEVAPSQGGDGAVPAGATGGNLTQANNQDDGGKGGQGKAKGNDNGKKNGQENKGKGENNGKGNGNEQDNKGKGNNNGKGKGQDNNKGKGNNNGKGGKK
jgi:serine/threonine protein kinase